MQHTHLVFACTTSDTETCYRVPSARPRPPTPLLLGSTLAVCLSAGVFNRGAAPGVKNPNGPRHSRPRPLRFYGWKGGGLEDVTSQGPRNAHRRPQFRRAMNMITSTCGGNSVPEILHWLACQWMNLVQSWGTQG